MQLDVMRSMVFEDLKVGDQATMEHTVTQRDIDLFAHASGDFNPAHMDPEYAEKSMFKGVIAHGMFTAGLISALLGTKFPGPGTIYIGQTLKFTAPVRLGDTVTVTLTVKSRNEEKKWVTLDCKCVNQKGKSVVSGEAEVMPPTQHIEWTPHGIPEVTVNR